MTPPTAAVLQIEDLGFAYAGQPPVATHWSLAVGVGVTFLHGDTGSGKSTVLRCLSGDLPATGHLTLTGTRLEDDAAGYRRKLLRVDSTTDEFDRLPVRACRFSLSDAEIDPAEWQALIEGFALQPHLDKALYMLSTGSRRKAWLAVALACRRPLVLLDDPVAGLDGPSVRCLLAALARRAKRRDGAVIVASAERLDVTSPSVCIGLPLPKPI